MSAWADGSEWRSRRRRHPQRCFERRQVLPGTARSRRGGNRAEPAGSCSVGTISYRDLRIVGGEHPGSSGTGHKTAVPTRSSTAFGRRAPGSRRRRPARARRISPSYRGHGSRRCRCRGRGGADHRSRVARLARRPLGACRSGGSVFAVTPRSPKRASAAGRIATGDSREGRAVWFTVMRDTTWRSTPATGLPISSQSKSTFASRSPVCEAVESSRSGRNGSRTGQYFHSRRTTR